jgi:hypothetical protein
MLQSILWDSDACVYHADSKFEVPLLTIFKLNLILFLAIINFDVLSAVSQILVDQLMV